MNKNKCECKAGHDEHSTEIKLPNWVNGERKNRHILVDPCVVLVLLHLWHCDIETLSICCGHNKGNPSVMVLSSYSAGKISEIREHIAVVDDRVWEIEQWKMVSHLTTGDYRIGNVTVSMI